MFSFLSDRLNGFSQQVGHVATCLWAEGQTSAHLHISGENCPHFSTSRHTTNVKKKARNQIHSTSILVAEISKFRQMWKLFKSNLRPQREKKLIFDGIFFPLLGSFVIIPAAESVSDWGLFCIYIYIYLFPPRSKFPPLHLLAAHKERSTDIHQRQSLQTS